MYPYALSQRESLLYQNHVSDGQPRGNSTSDPTAQIAIRISKWEDIIIPIEKGLKRIPVEYQAGLLANIIHRKPYPYYADTCTWKRWKRRLVYYIAQEKGWI